MRRRKPAEVFVEAALSQSNDPRNIAAGDDCGALIARRRGLLCRNRTGVGAAAAESVRPTHAIGRLDLGLGDCRHFQLSPSLERTAGLTAP
jgi:hypothetical protein